MRQPTERINGVKPRPAVMKLARRMEHNLLLHDNTKGRQGWKGCDLVWLFE